MPIAAPILMHALIEAYPGFLQMISSTIDELERRGEDPRRYNWKDCCLRTTLALEQEVIQRTAARRRQDQGTS